MSDRPNTEEVQQALEKHRNAKDPYVNALRIYLPQGPSKIASVHEEYGFVDSFVKRNTAGGGFIGKQSEIFFLCREMIEYIPEEQRPDLEKTIGENSIDIILDIEKEPFYMICFDENTLGYVLGSTEKAQELDIGHYRRSKKTDFIVYEPSDITDNIDFYSFSIESCTISRINPKN
jgi:hypothetical protein